MQSKDTEARNKKQDQVNAWLQSLPDRFPTLRSTAGEAYLVDAAVAVPLGSDRARDILTADLWKRYGRRASSQVLNTALSVLSDRAQRSAPQAVGMRVVALATRGGFDLDRGDSLVLDLGRPDCFVVVDSSGVRLDRSSPIPFRRPEGMKPLPAPELPPKASLRETLEPLWPAGMEPSAKILAVCFLLGALMPAIAQPILLITGPPGSGKSMTAALLRNLVDPVDVPLSRPPASTRDLYVSAFNQHVVAFDNVSTISPELADDLCALTSGTGYGTRRLYTDAEQQQFSGRRPVLLTAIDVPSLRSDLLDRTLWTELPEMTSRISELDLAERVQRAASTALGALLNTLWIALTAWKWPELQPESPMRLLDLHRLCRAATLAPELGWSLAEVEQALQDNVARWQERERDYSPVFELLVTVAERGFEGTAQQLLEALEELAPGIQSRRGDLPRSPAELGRELSQLAPKLRAAGVRFERYRGRGRNRARGIRLSWDTEETAGSSNGNK